MTNFVNPINGESEKMCYSCNQFLSYTRFSKNKFKSDGYNAECKSCYNKFNRKIECECGSIINKYYYKTHIKFLCHQKKISL